MGYHDAYASGVIHAIAGGAALGVLVVLGPRIGKFGAERRDPEHPDRTTCGWRASACSSSTPGFWGFYAACNIPVFNIGTESGAVLLGDQHLPDADHAVGHHLQLPDVAVGRPDGRLLPRRRAIRTGPSRAASPGIIAASAGNDLYHPIQATLVGVVGAIIAYKGHYYVERRFKIDDGVGAVAVHGYSGFFGVVIAGFLLWGYPAAAPVDGSAAALVRRDGRTASR